MGGFSLVHWIIVLLVILILFGRGRISEIMGDFGKGIKSFKQGITEEEKKPSPPRIENAGSTVEAEKEARPSEKSTD